MTLDVPVKLGSQLYPHHHIKVSAVLQRVVDLLVQDAKLHKEFLEVLGLLAIHKETNW